MTRLVVVAISVALGFVLQFQAASAATEKVIYAFCSLQTCTDGLGPAGALISGRERQSIWDDLGRRHNRPWDGV